MGEIIQGNKIDKKVTAKKKIKKIFLIFVLLIVSFISGFFSCYFGWGKAYNEQDDPDDYNVTIISRQVEKALENCSSLVAARHHYQAVEIYESQKEFIGIKVPFTKNKVVYVYSGVVGASIDLSEVDYEVSSLDKTITINLPAVDIEYSDVDEDSFEYPYEDYSVFNKPNMSEYVDLINVLESKKADEMLNNTEFLTTTRNNAKEVLSGFIYATEEAQEYEIIFK